MLNTDEIKVEYLEDEDDKWSQIFSLLMSDQELNGAGHRKDKHENTKEGKIG